MEDGAGNDPQTVLSIVGDAFLRLWTMAVDVMSPVVVFFGNHV